MDPLISIIIPTYNRFHFLGETLESILAQTWQNWECLVIDDGSTDYTENLLEFYCAKDTRISFLYRPKNVAKGANSCRNYGFEKSKGDYIQWLDSDDLISPNKIEEQVVLLNEERIDITFCKWAGFKDDPTQFTLQGNQELLQSCNTPAKLFDYLGQHNDFLPPHVYLMKKELMCKAGGWNEYLRINQDGEFFSRVLLVSRFIKYSSRGVAYYRRGEGNDNTSIYNQQEKVDDGVWSWKLIEQSHKIRYKANSFPYVENAKRQLFYSIWKAGFVEYTFKHPVFFEKELEKWRLENKKRKSLSRKLRRIKRFIEVKVFRKQVSKQ